MSAGEPDHGASAQFEESWAALLREGLGLTVQPGARQRLTARTAELLRRSWQGDPVCTAAAEEAGTLLVEAHYTDPSVLARAVELLQAHPVPKDRGPVVAGAFAAGWAAALREQTLRDQEEIRAAADTARQTAERSLRATEARFRALFENAPIGIGIGDLQGNVLEVNRALLDIFGGRVEELRGRRVTDLVHPEDEPGTWQAYDELIRGERERFECTKPYYRKDGEVVWTHLTCSLIRDEELVPRYQVALLEDITDRYRLEERLRHQATHDTLTGLPNRAAFIDRLERLFRAPLADARFGICYLDLDGFKFVNDSLGHAAGDELLVAVARRLENAMTPLGHLVARLGGDEFVMLLEHSRGQQDAVTVAKAALAALATPVPVADRRLSVRASVGVLERSVATTTPEAAVRAADLTLYRAKEAGRGRWTLFDPGHHAREVTRYAMSVRMPTALERGEFFVDYQPLCTLSDGSLAAVEALVRWRHPDFGVLSPDDFIATAEQTGMIMRLGRWVLEEACGQAAEWVRRFGPAAPQVNVNVSVHQARDARLAADVGRVLRSTGLDPTRLQLEITESAVMRTDDDSMPTLRSLADTGITLAVDDFGTGWSPLGYLGELPVSGLKIAGSFLADTHRPEVSAQVSWRVIEGLVSLARALGVKVTAEGVETAGDAERLRAMGCDWGQGWHFGRPARPGEITRRITEELRRAAAHEDAEFYSE